MANDGDADQLDYCLWYTYIIYMRLPLRLLMAMYNVVLYLLFLNSNTL